MCRNCGYKCVIVAAVTVVTVAAKILKLITPVRITRVAFIGSAVATGAQCNHLAIKFLE